MKPTGRLVLDPVSQPPLANLKSTSMICPGASALNESQRADQRARILDAVQLVVFERGYLGTKIGDVASRAGVSRATFYELFGSKEDCFLASHDQSATLASDRVAEAVAAARGQTRPPPPSRLCSSSPKRSPIASRA